MYFRFLVSLKLYRVYINFVWAVEMIMTCVACLVSRVVRVSMKPYAWLFSGDCFVNKTCVSLIVGSSILSVNNVSMISLFITVLDQTKLSKNLNQKQNLMSCKIAFIIECCKNQNTECMTQLEIWEAFLLCIWSTACTSECSGPCSESVWRVFDEVQWFCSSCVEYDVLVTGCVELAWCLTGMSTWNLQYWIE